MRYFVTGCAGFIGSHMTDRLLSQGHQVIGYDNMSTGQTAFLAEARCNPSFEMVKGDLLDLGPLSEAMSGCDIVVHLAANADVRYGPKHPTKDFHQNTLGTLNVLEAMRSLGVKRIAFASTGSVYGEAETIPTPEAASFPVQTSLYGASKVSAEAFIQAYCESFDMRGCIFRFVSILGERYTHGHIFDFYSQLRVRPTQLSVLGNGRQRKSYLYVQDCVDAVLMAVERCEERLAVFNLGTNEYCEVNDSIRWICEELQLNPVVTYGGGDRGWIGDNPFIFLDCTKIAALGWTPRLSIREGVLHTVRYLRKHPEILDGGLQQKSQATFFTKAAS